MRTKRECRVDINKKKGCGPSLLRSSHCSCLAAWGYKPLSAEERGIEAHSIGGQFLRIPDELEPSELLRNTRQTHLGQTATIESFLLLLGRRVLTETESGGEKKRWQCVEMRYLFSPSIRGFPLFLASLSGHIELGLGDEA